MKIKYNIPSINKIKESIKNIGNRIKKNQRKVPLKYYVLLALMIIVGIITFSVNVKRYNDITSEKYTKHELNDWLKVDSNKVDKIENVDNGGTKDKIYDTAVSSISTNVANFTEEENEKVLLSTNYIWPVRGEVIKKHATNELVYSKTLDMWKVHPGIDISSQLGENVLAIQDGKVISKKTDSFYGNTIKIEHSNGYVSVYSNLDEFYDISEGSTVKQGDVIGKVGYSSYGEIEDNTHLHFEIVKDNEWLNPIDILE